MIKIAIYCRKSVEKENSISVENQLEFCKSHFSRLYDNCQFFEFKDDGYTGANTNRPAFARMMTLARAKQFNIIASYKLDRIARSTVDYLNIFEELKSLDIPLISVSEGYDPSTPEGQLMMKMLSSFAELERQNIAKRVKDSMEERAKIGCFSGGTCPTGYEITVVDFNGKKLKYLKLIPKMKDKINEFFKLAAEGYSINQIHKKFNIPQKTIYNIIQNPTYLEASEKSKNYLESIGYRVFGELKENRAFLPYNRRCSNNSKRESNSEDKFVAVSFHEPIVSSDIWIAANENVKKRGKEGRPNISKKSFLAKLPKCSCGSGMFIHESANKKYNSKKLYFRCSAQKASGNCNSIWLRVDKVEEIVLNFLKNISLDKETLKNYCRHKNSTSIDYELLIKEKNKQLSKIENEINNLKLNLRFITGGAAKLIGDDINKLYSKKETIEIDIDNLQSKSLNASEKLDIDNLHSYIKWFIDNFHNLDMDDKQIFAKNIISKIEYNGIDEVKIIF